jgi:hypothetical protein
LHNIEVSDEDDATLDDESEESVAFGVSVSLLAVVLLSTIALLF